MLKQTLKTISALLLSGLIVLSSIPATVHAEEDDDFNIFEITLSEAADKQTVKSTVFRFLADYEALTQKERSTIDAVCNTQEPSKDDVLKFTDELTSLRSDMKKLYMRSSDILSLIRMLEISEADDSTLLSEAEYLHSAVEYIRERLTSDAITIDALLSVYTSGNIDFNVLKTVLAEKSAAESDLSIANEDLESLKIQTLLYTAMFDELTAYNEEHRFDTPEEVSSEEESPEEAESEESMPSEPAPSSDGDYVPMESGVDVHSPITLIVTEEAEPELTSEEILIKLTSLRTKQSEKEREVAELTSRVNELNEKIKTIALGEELSEPVDIAIPDEGIIAEDEPAISITEVGSEESTAPSEDGADPTASLIESIPLDYIIYGAAGIGALVVMYIILKKKKTAKNALRKSTGPEATRIEIEGEDDAPSDDESVSDVPNASDEDTEDDAEDEVTPTTIEDDDDEYTDDEEDL